MSRALEKLRRIFSRRGVTATVTLIAAAISTHSIQAAPFGLATKITATVLQGSVVAGTTLTLVKGTLHLMTHLRCPRLPRSLDSRRLRGLRVSPSWKARSRPAPTPLSPPFPAPVLFLCPHVTRMSRAIPGQGLPVLASPGPPLGETTGPDPDACALHSKAAGVPGSCMPDPHRSSPGPVKKRPHDSRSWVPCAGPSMRPV